MSKPSNIELLRQTDNDLKYRYKELLCLRARVSSLLFPLQTSPTRMLGILATVSQRLLTPSDCKLTSMRRRRNNLLRALLGPDGA